MTAVRERWAWALLFGLAPGVGVGLATARTLQAELTHPLVVAAGATTAGALVVFLLVATNTPPTPRTE